MLYVVLYSSSTCFDFYLFFLARHRGVYVGQDVAVKVLRSETLNEALEDEFCHEVSILR